MKALVKFTEIISDNYQGGSGKIFDRQTIMSIDEDISADQIFTSIEYRIREHSPVFYDVTDKQKIVVRSVEIFK